MKLPPQMASAALAIGLLISGSNKVAAQNSQQSFNRPAPTVNVTHSNEVDNLTSAAQITEIIKDIIAKAHSTMPNAKMPGTIKIILNLDESLNAAVERDSSTDLTLSLNQGLLNLFKQPGGIEICKFALGHEIAHKVFEMNPQLRNDPRFLPQSKEFQAEFKSIYFTLEPNALKAIGEAPKRAAAIQAAAVKIKKNYYIEEAQADKMGLVISGCNIVSAERFIQAIDPKHRTPKEIGAMATPHPSQEVRLIELVATKAAMNRALNQQGQTRVAGREERQR